MHKTINFLKLYKYHQLYKLIKITKQIIKKPKFSKKLVLFNDISLIIQKI